MNEKLQQTRVMTRTQLVGLSLRSFEGPVHVVREAAEAGKAAALLGRERVLGFDTETRPAFRKGVSYPISLIQLAGRDAAYIFKLKHMTMPLSLIELFENPCVAKAGVALTRDIQQLRKLCPFEPAGFVDLGLVARQAGLKQLGLRNLVALLLGFRVSKQQRTTNWALPRLTKKQIRYAATDAWAGRELYLAMKREGYSMVSGYVPVKKVRLPASRQAQVRLLCHAKAI